MKAQILTPDGKVFENEVTGMQVPGELGSFEIKKNHAALVSNLDVGRVRAQISETDAKYFAISNGFVEVVDNNIYLLAEAAEPAEKIDVERAQNAKQRAEERLYDQNMDQERARHAWFRAENRVKIASSGR